MVWWLIGVVDSFLKFSLHHLMQSHTLSLSNSAKRLIVIGPIFLMDFGDGPKSGALDHEGRILSISTRYSFKLLIHLVRFDRPTIYLEVAGGQGLAIIGIVIGT